MTNLEQLGRKLNEEFAEPPGSRELYFVYVLSHTIGSMRLHLVYKVILENCGRLEFSCAQVNSMAVVLCLPSSLWALRG